MNKKVESKEVIRVSQSFFSTDANDLAKRSKVV